MFRIQLCLNAYLSHIPHCAMNLDADEKRTVEEFKMSNKLKKLCKLVKSIVHEKGEKVVIFSQFTSMMSIIGRALAVSRTNLFLH